MYDCREQRREIGLKKGAGQLVTARSTCYNHIGFTITAREGMRCDTKLTARFCKQLTSI
jgi:hypothetical protein